MTTAKSKRLTDGELVTVVGASGSGKTLYTMRACARAARLIVWDSHLQWWERGCRPVRTIPELAQACSTSDPAQLAFVGPVNSRNFGYFSRIALCWGRIAPCTVVAEELAEVTSPGKAPPGWGELLRWARKKRITVYGITQRPAESDKTLIGNSQRIVCHAVNGLLDARYMAGYMPVHPEEIIALDFTRLEYLERLPDRTMRAGFNPLPSAKKI